MITSTQATSNCIIVRYELIESGIFGRRGSREAVSRDLGEGVSVGAESQTVIDNSTHSTGPSSKRS
jgi:hypothetical protein